MIRMKWSCTLTHLVYNITFDRFPTNDGRFVDETRVTCYKQDVDVVLNESQGSFTQFGVSQNRTNLFPPSM